VLIMKMNFWLREDIRVEKREDPFGSQFLHIHGIQSE
jgi:hypothetical protein